MVTEAILGIVTTVAAWVLSLLPTFTLPTWVAGLAGTLSSGLDQVRPLGWWVPFAAMGQVIGLFLLVLGVAFAIRVVRILLSLFTAGGGSAA